MTVAEQTLAEFGRSLGLDHLAFIPDRATVLALEAMGTLTFEFAGPAEAYVAISLSRATHRLTEEDPRTWLARSHFRRRRGEQIHVGGFRDHRIALVLVPVEDFTLPRIHQVIRQLDREHQAQEVAS